MILILDKNMLVLMKRSNIVLADYFFDNETKN